MTEDKFSPTEIDKIFLNRENITMEKAVEKYTVPAMAIAMTEVFFGERLNAYIDKLDKGLDTSEEKRLVSLSAFSALAGFRLDRTFIKLYTNTDSFRDLLHDAVLEKAVFFQRTLAGEKKQSVTQRLQSNKKDITTGNPIQRTYKDNGIER